MAVTPADTEWVAKAPPSKIVQVMSPSKYTLSYARIVRGAAGCRRLGSVKIFAPKNGQRAERLSLFASSEQAVDAWLCHMRSKFADMEDITHLGWSGWGLVFRYTNARGNVCLYSVMVDGFMP